jgi:hypothetical protein
MSEFVRGSEAYNTRWMNWCVENKEKVDFFIDMFPSIILANDIDWITNITNPDYVNGDDLNYYDDLIYTMIIALRFPQWKEVL